MADNPGRPADRPERARELEALRRERAEQLAIQTAVANERINTRLGLLEEHKQTVNEQIDRLVAGQDEMNDHLQRITEEMKIAKKVSEALMRNSEAAGARKLTLWQKWGLVVGSFVGIGTVTLLLIQTLNGLGHG